MWSEVGHIVRPNGDQLFSGSVGGDGDRPTSAMVRAWLVMAVTLTHGVIGGDRVTVGTEIAWLSLALYLVTNYAASPPRSGTNIMMTEAIVFCVVAVVGVSLSLDHNHIQSQYL